MTSDYNDLEPDQQEAYNLAVNPKEGITRIVGYAGVGKTTIMALVAKELGDRCEVLAPTNKAVLNLHKRGIKKAKTIHSCLYMPHEITIYKKDSSDNIVFTKGDDGEFLIDDHGDKIPEILETELVFGLKELEDGASIPPIALVDESSMPDEDIVADLEEFFAHIVFFGDDFQLPPVGKNKKSALDMGEADIKLTKVHRVAEGNPIISYATSVRNHEEIPLKDIAEKGTAICACSSSNTKLYETIVENDMQCISYRNKTRHNVNEKIRDAKGLTKNVLVEGETIVCNSNVYELVDDGWGDKKKRLKFYNGQVLKVLGSYEATNDHLIAITIRVEDDSGKTHTQRVWPFWNEGFFDIKDDNRRWNNEIQRRKAKGSKGVLFGSNFDYSYCLTAHKAQGSEYPIVCIFDERSTLHRVPKLEKQRWYYTAITRAKERILIVV